MAGGIWTSIISCREGTTAEVSFHNKLIAKLRMYGSLYVDLYCSGLNIFFPVVAIRQKLATACQKLPLSLVALFKEAALALCCFYCISMTYLITLMT